MASQPSLTHYCRTEPLMRMVWTVLRHRAGEHGWTEVATGPQENINNANDARLLAISMSDADPKSLYQLGLTRWIVDK